MYICGNLFNYSLLKYIFLFQYGGSPSIYEPSFVYHSPATCLVQNCVECRESAWKDQQAALSNSVDRVQREQDTNHWNTRVEGEGWTLEPTEPSATSYQSRRREPVSHLRDGNYTEPETFERFSHVYAEVQDFFHQYGGQDSQGNSSAANNNNKNGSSTNGDMNSVEIVMERAYPSPPLSSPSSSSFSSYSSATGNSSHAVRNLTPYFEVEEAELILPSLSSEFIQEFPGMAYFKFQFGLSRII